MTQSLGIGIVGMGWMGQTHGRAWRGLPERFHKTGIGTRLIVCADALEARARASQQRLGFQEYTTDWQQVVADERVDLVAVTASNDLHLPVVQAAAQAGKHVFCEKPVGRSPQETLACADAVRSAGVLGGVGYNYRYAPMVQYARQLIREGRLGDVTHFRGRFIVDYGSDPNGALSWRFQRERSGWGVLGDVMSHVVDMAIHLVGPVRRVTARQRTFIEDRPLADPGGGSHFSVGTGPRGNVTNEDYVSALADFQNRAVGTFEVSRVAKGHDCEFAFEINGTRGAVKWNYQRLHELELRLPEGRDEADGWTTIQAGPGHPDYASFYPGPGNSVSYDDLKSIEAVRFATAVVTGQLVDPSLDDALAVAEVLDAMLRSCASGGWSEVRRLADSQQ